jgi:hypothetical protein
MEPDRHLVESLMGGDAWLKPGEVGELLRVDASTVTRWAADGRFPDSPSGKPGVMTTPGGREIRIRRSVVIGLMDGTLQPREAGTDGRD